MSEREALAARAQVSLDELVALRSVLSSDAVLAPALERAIMTMFSVCLWMGAPETFPVD
jgi:hypothetical protein